MIKIELTTVDIVVGEEDVQITSEGTSEILTRDEALKIYHALGDYLIRSRQ